jgi:cell shape-determining protein MreC
MTMTSPNPFEISRQSRRRSPLLGPALLVVAGVLVLAAILRWRDTAASLFWNIGTPIVDSRNLYQHTSVADLQAALASSTAALADRNALSNENTELKRLLGRQIQGVQVISAVLMRPPGIPYDTLMIDAGKKDGIRVGELVFGGGKSAIGEISEVYDTASRVLLFSAPGRTFDAQVMPAATPGAVLPLSLAGQGAGSIVGQVPAGSTVVVGDSVLIPGLGSAFVGSVTHIDAPTGSSFETLLIQLPVNIFSLQFVEIQTH